MYQKIGNQTKSEFYLIERTIYKETFLPRVAALIPIVLLLMKTALKLSLSLSTKLTRDFFKLNLTDKSLEGM